jgi:hypothetical protein
MEAKLKWFERFLTWTARTKNTGAGPAAAPVVPGTASTTETSVQRERDDDFVVEVLPDHGAFAVRGPNYHGSDDDDDDDDDEDEDDDVSGGGGGGGDDEASDDAPLRVDSYVVRERLTDDEIRERILAGTARAEIVAVVPPDGGAGKPGRRFGSAQLLLLLLAGAVALIAAIAVGVAVPLAARHRASAPTNVQLPPRDEDVVAALRYLEWQGSGGFASAMFAESRSPTGLANGSRITSGAVELIKCRPAVCTESDENCLTADKLYRPGCCAGPGCPNATKCSDNCPKPPDSCSLTDPDNATCIRSSCYTCSQVDGKDEYVLTDHAWAVDCLEVGTATRPENGETYKWAIFCGPVIAGPIAKENRDLGEYQCAAARLGANYSDEAGGLLVAEIPCQFIALAECGCGPADMFTFGLPDPAGPCPPNGTCPFLCEDAGGVVHARNLCRAFPGNISWWEGRNAFNFSMFWENLMAPDYELEIYIKGVDD